jgi:hypothetical protein
VDVAEEAFDHYLGRLRSFGYIDSVIGRSITVRNLCAGVTTLLLRPKFMVKHDAEYKIA